MVLYPTVACLSRTMIVAETFEKKKCLDHNDSKIDLEMEQSEWNYFDARAISNWWIK